jgi:hypothetical protein
MASIIRHGERQWQARVRRKAVHPGASFEKARAAAWARPGAFQRNSCRDQFTATAGAVTKRGKIPLNK